MRKILISIGVGLLLILSLLFMVKGIDAINIKGFIGLNEKNEEIENQISDLSNTISVTYSNTASNLKRAATTLTNSKTEYENQAMLSSSNGSSYISQSEMYDIDYLWLKIGNYANQENIYIKIELTSNETNSSLYNLNFTATGDYVNITQFIYDIENDTKLGFKIEDFKMTSSGGSLLVTFSCKEISISVGTIEAATSDSSESATDDKSTETSNGTDTNTSNTTNENTTQATSTTANNTETSDTASSGASTNVMDY